MSSEIIRSGCKIEMIFSPLKPLLLLCLPAVELCIVSFSATFSQTKWRVNSWFRPNKLIVLRYYDLVELQQLSSIVKIRLLENKGKSISLFKIDEEKRSTKVINQSALEFPLLNDFETGGNQMPKKKCISHFKTLFLKSWYHFWPLLPAISTNLRDCTK